MNETEQLALLGTTEPTTPIQYVQLGALSLELEAGALRHIRYRGQEILRALQFVVRDANWGTYAPARSNETETRHEQCWEYGYEAEIDEALSYRLAVRATANRIEATAQITATADFTTNRTGFVLLHPLIGVAGCPVTVIHSDGREEPSRFPELISPGQPFFDIRALRQTLASGITVECVLAGDVFEMEDQRNWTDASFKTYNRPLALPFPYVIEAGRSFSQSVTLTIDDPQPAAASAAGGHGPVVLEVTATSGASLPELGLGVHPGQTGPALQARERLQILRPAHLYVPLDLRSDATLAELASAAELGAALNAPLWLAVIVPGAAAPSAELTPLARATRALARPPAGLLVLPAAYLKSYQPSGPWPDGPTPDDAVTAARELFPSLAVGGGMLTYFTELNRCRPNVPVDFISHATCAIVHAADDVSVMETLQSLPYVFRSARRIAPDIPYRIDTGAIALWTNPYGAATVANPDGRRIPMAGDDPRQRGLFGAAWQLGYYAAAAREGVDALTLGSASGPFAVVADERLYPVFHVVRGLAGGRGCSPLGVANPASERLAAVGWQRPDGAAELWLANLTATPVDARIDNLGNSKWARLDAASVAAAAAEPAWLDQLAPAAEPSFSLPAYAVTRVIGTLNNSA